MSLYDQAYAEGYAEGVSQGRYIWKIQFIEEKMNKPISNTDELGLLPSSDLRDRFESLVAEHEVFYQAALNRQQSSAPQAPASP